MSNIAKDKNKDAIDALEKVLVEQIDLYEKYAEHLDSDVDFMARLRIDELEKNNKSKHTLLLKVQAMDQARKNLVSQIARQHGIAEENVKITDICKVTTANQGERLLAHRDRLHSVMDRLKKIQENTAVLANTSLAWINSSMATLRGMLTPAGTYNLQGKVDHPSAFAGRVVEKRA